MGSDQQFCLRWNNFQSSLLASLPQLLDADDLTDVTLSAGGRNIRAHRVVLSACSQYFKDLFREMQSFQHPVIVLPQTTFSDLCSLVTFMYSGEVNIYQDQLAGLLSTADVLHIRGLAEVPHANGTPLKKKVNEESLHQEPIASSQSLHRKKISGLSPSTTLNESPAQASLGKINRLEKAGKLIPGKKRAFEREELEESEPPFVQVKVEQGIEGIVESPIMHTRKAYHHHPTQVLHPVQPLLPEKHERAPQGGDSYSLPHPTEDAVGIEGEVGYPEGNQAPTTTGTTIQGHHSSSEDSGGGGNGGGNSTEPEHHNLGQGMIIIPSNQIPSSRQSVNCPVCGRLISQRRNLKQHMKTHLNHADGGADKNRMRLADGSTAWLGEKRTSSSSLVSYSGSKGDNIVGHSKEWFVMYGEKRDSRLEGHGASNTVLNNLSVLGNEISSGGDEEIASEQCDIQEQQWFNTAEKRDGEFRNAGGIMTSDKWLLQKEVCHPVRENLVTDVGERDKETILMSTHTLPSDAV